MAKRQGGTITLQIEVWGIVQGVGFRPFVAKLADRLGVRGQVRNMGGHVSILASGEEAAVRQFADALRTEKPRPAQIVSISVSRRPYQPFSGFFVEDSGKGGDGIVMLPPDLAVCEDCMAELKNPANVRYRHPLISCMACGPRYSILDALPYDRENTAMAAFELCPTCSREYTDRADRRYHAQTISCHNCGPQVFFHTTDKDLTGHPSSGEQALAETVSALKNGGIVAVKGIGGYHLACNPFDASAVSALRRFKNREEKPFAVMFRDMAQLRVFCVANDREEQALTSAANPIVLLQSRPSDMAASVGCTSRLTGAMLPGTALHWLLVDACGPLVMTSANLSGSPIIKSDEEMLSCASEKLSGVLLHPRGIRVSLDDSVLRFVDGQMQMVRRSKGYAPLPLQLGLRHERSPALLALGGQLKSAFCLTKGSFAYVSQYFGDLDDLRTLELYRAGTKHLQHLLALEPELCVCDLHPRYNTTAMAVDSGLPVLRVQHHHAHAASVIAEHGLYGPVLAVTFDGTGYGTDGTVWGGEFLLCRGREMHRAAHLETISFLGGDVSMKDAWKSACCHLRAAGLEDRITDERYPTIRQALSMEINTIRSSSMGRLFDAVSSYLGIWHHNGYEGQCAVLLEQSAEAAQRNGEPEYPMDFDLNWKDGVLLSSPSALFHALTRGLDEGVSTGRLALGFHEAAARMIAEVCGQLGPQEAVSQIALSGGVFHNALLLEKTTKLLQEKGFQVYTNQAVPVGDGGICLGQAYLGMLQLGMSPTEP